MSFVVGTLHMMIEPVSLADARCCPLGLNATTLTGPSWRVKLHRKSIFVLLLATCEELFGAALTHVPQGAVLLVMVLVLVVVVSTGTGTGTWDCGGDNKHVDNIGNSILQMLTSVQLPAVAKQYLVPVPLLP